MSSHPFMVQYETQLPSFLRLHRICCEWYIPHCIHPFICRTSALLPPLGCCVLCCREHGYANTLQDTAFNSFGFIPRSGIAKSYGSPIFKFWRKHHTVFHSSCTILQSHYMSATSLYHCQHFLFSVLSIVASLIGVTKGIFKRYKKIISETNICVCVCVCVILWGSNWNNWQRINFQNIQATHATQYQKNKQCNQKESRWPKQTFIQRTHTDS